MEHATNRDDVIMQLNALCAEHATTLRDIERATRDATDTRDKVRAALKNVQVAISRHTPCYSGQIHCIIAGASCAFKVKGIHADNVDNSALHVDGDLLPEKITFDGFVSWEHIRLTRARLAAIQLSFAHVGSPGRSVYKYLIENNVVMQSKRNGHVLYLSAKDGYMWLLSDTNPDLL